MTLLRNNHPQQDLFIPDIFDSIGATLKDDIASMEHPIFTLSSKPDMRHLEYKNNDISIEIIPSGLGLPNIFDKDILLYCMSLLMTEINAGRTPPKTLRISCRDLLITTNRRTDGHSYSRLKQAFDRLRGVTIKTNIETNKRKITKGFGILESYEVIESSKVKNRMVRLELTLSEWFYNSLLGKEVLSISRDYFRLSKPIERRLYEIARKHCGNARQWKIGLMKLMEKTGSTGTLRKFRMRIKELSHDNYLPDYRFQLDENDNVIFNRKLKSEAKVELPYISPTTLKKIKGDTIQRAQDLVAGTGWDFNYIIEQWGVHMEKTGAPDNINGALIGFVKKKIKNAPL